MLGYPDQALEQTRQALHLAQELSQPWTLAVALGYAAVVHTLRGARQIVHERAEAAIRLATEHGFPSWVARGMMLRGWAQAEQGQGADGLAQIRQGMAIWQATGQKLGEPLWLALLAEQCGNAGQAAEGLHVLSEALAIAHTRGLRLWEAELHRLQGELLLRQTAGQKRSRTVASETEAEARVRQALDIARGQGAKSFELRAAMSLSRLWQCQGRRDEARELLAGIYGWFTEGFDTADLQEAKVLLKALS
jgi:predicted ATPase